MYKVIAKTCTKCGLIKLLNDFCNSFDGKFGKKSQCKVCNKKYKETCKLKPKTVIKEKVCTKCGILKSATEYHKYIKASDGLSASCKECNNSDNKKYYYTHQDEKATYRKTRSHIQREYNRIYHKSHCEDVNHIYGKLNPNCRVGRGVISERIVESVLKNCINCNDMSFNFKYDLINDKYNTINVKSSTLFQNTKNSFNWSFRILENSEIPDTFICVGFSEYRTKILKVWAIPSNASVIKMGGILITNSETGLQRASQYEVDATPYNNAYQNLDIYTLPEFRNLSRNDINTSVPINNIECMEVD